MSRIRVLVANHPRLMRELISTTMADQPDIELLGEAREQQILPRLWLRQDPTGSSYQWIAKKSIASSVDSCWDNTLQ